MITLCLFDIDNTLIRWSKSHRKAFSIAFMKVYGKHAHVETINHHGMTDQQIIHDVLLKKGLREEQVISKLPECMQTITTAFREEIEKENLHLLKGVTGLLEALQSSSHILGIVTGNLKSIADIKLQRTGISNYFKVGAYGSDHIDRTTLIRLAVRRAETFMDCTLSDRTFMFGDTPRDIMAGKDAGVKTVGVATGNYSLQQLKAIGANFVFKDLSDSEHILLALESQKHR